MSIQEILDARKAVKPIAEKDGRKIVSFEDYVALTNADFVDPTPSTCQRTYNPDGSIARTNKPYSAVNENRAFANRVYVTKKKMKVVLDYRVIEEQASGEISKTHIPAYVFERDENGNLYISTVENVTDQEFVTLFTQELNHNVIKDTIAPLVDAYGSDVDKIELPI